jgi:hypothetical protein
MWLPAPDKEAAVEPLASAEAVCRPERKPDSATERMGAQREASAMTLDRGLIQRLRLGLKELQPTARKYEEWVSTAGALLHAAALTVAAASSPAAESSGESSASAASSGAEASLPAAT